MSTLASDTIAGFLTNTISYFIEKHDPAADGASTGEIISLYQRLKDLVRDDIRYSYQRAEYIAKRMVEIAPDHDEVADIDKLPELADEINDWR